MPALILVRGGGDLASGVALRLHRAGLSVAITELAQPLAVRRTVSFAEAIYDKEIAVEGVSGHAVDDPTDTLKILNVFGKRQIPVVVDPDCVAARTLSPLVIVDARMLKRAPEKLVHRALLYIGLGPGFNAPVNCQAVVETQRGHRLGRVIWQGSGAADSALPEGDPRRVLRAPADGTVIVHKQIGQRCAAGELVAEVSGEPVLSPFDGVVRGLIREGLSVPRGLKIGDVTAREDPDQWQLVSDKALAVGGGILEAILAAGGQKQALELMKIDKLDLRELPHRLRSDCRLRGRSNGQQRRPKANS